ncbi:MAG: ribonuclease P [Thermoprotei archaeon]|nr:MAG: ribonuclease P [Thermoprotei archaeon]
MGINMLNKIKYVRDLARQRAMLLFKLAAEAAERGEVEWSRRYAWLVLRLSQAVRYRLPKNVKRRICKMCRVVLVPGATARVRIRSRGRHVRITVTCLACGYIHRIEFKKPGRSCEKKLDKRIEEEEGRPKQS